jgi:hypothetical protein
MIFIFLLLVAMNMLLKQLTAGYKENLYSFLNIIVLFINKELSFQSWIPFIYGNFIRYGVISLFYALIIILAIKIFHSNEEQIMAEKLNFTNVFRATVLSVLLVSLTYGTLFYIISKIAEFYIQNFYVGLIISNIYHISYILIIFSILLSIDKGINLRSYIIEIMKFLFSKHILLIIIVIVLYSLILLAPINILYMNQMKSALTEGLFSFFDAISFKLPFWFIVSNIISESILYLVLFMIVTYIYLKSNNGSSDAIKFNIQEPTIHNNQ